MNSSVTPLTITVLPEVAFADSPSLHPLTDRAVQPEAVRPETSRPDSSGTIAASLFNRRTGALAGAAIATVAGTSLVQLANQPAQYEGKFQLLVEPSAVASTNAAQATPQPTLPAPSIDYETQIQVLWSPKLLSPVVQQLQTQYPDLNYDTLAQKLDIAHRDGEKTLEITYHDSDPQKVQAVLTKVSQAYLQYSQECRTSLCRELNFVEKRLPKLQVQAKIAKQNLQKFQEQHDLSEPSVLGQQLSQQSGVLRQQRQDLQIRLTEARTRSTILQKRLVGQGDAAQVEQWLAQNDRYQMLLGEFQDVTIQLAAELARPQPDRETLQTLKQRYQQTSQQLTQAAQQPIATQLAQAIATFQSQTNADYTAVMRQQTLLEWVAAVTQVQTLTMTERAIAQTEVAVNQQIKQWAGLAREYDALNLELKFATDNLNLYQTRRTELRQFVQPRTDWQLTAAPTVEAVAADGFALSDPERNVSIGLLLCFMLMILVMSVAEQTSPNRQPRRLPKPTVQPEYSWQLIAPEQSYTLTTQTVPALTAVSLPRQTIDRTAMFLLVAAARVQSVKRTPLALAPVNNC